MTAKDFKDYPIPEAAFEEHIAITGRTGAGKTWFAKTAVERLIGQGKKVCVIDPTGAWTGLKISRDGKHQGLSVVIFGGDHADIEITEHHGAQLADIIAEMSFPAVIDVSGMLLSEQRRFMTAFAEQIFLKVRGAFNLVIDEADSFMPQKPMRDQTMMLNRMDRLVRRGRSRGFRIMLLTQRPAALNKDSLSQVGTLVAMRLTSPQDRAAIEAWIEGQADRNRGKEIVDSLPGLKRGEGWVWSPGHDVLKRMISPEITTFDSSATPTEGKRWEHGQLFVHPDLSLIREKLMPVAENPTPARDLGHAEDAQPIDVAAIEREAYQSGYREGNRVGCGTADAVIKFLKENLSSALHETISSAIALRDAQGFEQDQYVPEPTPDAKKPAQNIPEIIPARHLNGEKPSLQKAERSILTALAQHNACDKNRLAILAGYAAAGGGFNNAISSLRVKEFITRDEQISITTKGRVALGRYEPLPTGRALVAHWMQHSALDKAARAILEVVTASPRPIDKSEVARRAHYEVSGGGFSNSLSRLRTLGLVSGSRQIAAAPELRPA